jgi:transposase
MIDIAQIDHNKLSELSVEELRELNHALLVRVERDRREIVWRDAKIDKLTFEIAQLKRMRFDRSSEQLSIEQRALFDEAVDGDIAAIDEQLTVLQATLPPKPDEESKRPKRMPLPERLPRRDVHHEAEDTTCGCGQALKRIGEDVSEKLDYTLGVFAVERHVRGKWCCTGCRTLVQAPVPPAVIDKGIPTAGLLAHVLVAKHADHLPLYRHEAILGPPGA